MKGSKLYIIGLLVFLVLVFMYEYFSPKEFIWNPTFNKYDKQPFGSFVFDDVMLTSVKDYTVENKTFYQLYREFGGQRDLEQEVAEEEDNYVADFLTENEFEEEKIGETDDSYDLTVSRSYDLPLLPLEKRRAFLLTEHDIEFSAVDVKAILNLLKQGHKIMLCLNAFPQILCDSICFSYEDDGYYSYIHSITRFARVENLRDSLFLGTDSLRPAMIYAVYPLIHPTSLKEGSSRITHYFRTEKDSLISGGKLRCDWSEIVVRNNEGKPLAMRLGIGEGELILVATPLMFTNYGMLDGGNASYAFRLLSYMKDLPLSRIEAYGRFANQASGSPLRYFLSQPPLRWALYVALCTIVLCMIFTAKRRQRAIPVVLPPANETLRFTQLIGNLYYQRKDYKDMLQKKYRYFCTEVKLLNGLDLHANEPDEELCRRLADKMGLDFGDIWPVFKELKNLLREDITVDEMTMMRMIDKMNEWITN